MVVFWHLCCGLLSCMRCASPAPFHCIVAYHVILSMMHSVWNGMHVCPPRYWLFLARRLEEVLSRLARVDAGKLAMASYSKS